MPKELIPDEPLEPGVFTVAKRQADLAFQHALDVHSDLEHGLASEGEFDEAATAAQRSIASKEVARRRLIIGRSN